jgi:hypothetical protein
MRRTLLLFIIGLVFNYTSTFAQDLTVAESSINISVTLDGGFYLGHLDFTNNTGSEMQVEWSRIGNDLPTGWQSFVCIEGGQCYPPNVDGSPANENWSIPAGATRWIEVQFKADEAEGAVSGTANVTIELSAKNSDASAQGMAVGTGFTSSLEDIDVTRVKLYPNPARDFIRISNADGVDQLEIYNLIGRKVKTFNNVHEGASFNVSDLPKGVYLVRMLNDDNDVLTTKRISKR